MRQSKNKREKLIRKVVASFRRKAEQELGSPVEMILFGSYARGEATWDSDIDLLVILPQLTHEILNTLFEISWEIGLNAGIVLSITPVAEEEIPTLQESPFFQAVRQEGVLIE